MQECKPAHEYQRICVRVYLKLFPGNKTPQIYLSQRSGATIFQLLATASTAFVRLLPLGGLHCSCSMMAAIPEFVFCLIVVAVHEISHKIRVIYASQSLGDDAKQCKRSCYGPCIAHHNGGLL